MAIGAAEMMLQCVNIGTLSVEDENIERRPYHRYCKCALHKLKGRNYSKSCPAHGNLSFPLNRAKGCSSLLLEVSKFSSQVSSISSISSSCSCNTVPSHHRVLAIKKLHLQHSFQLKSEGKVRKETREGVFDSE